MVINFKITNMPDLAQNSTYSPISSAVQASISLAKTLPNRTKKLATKTNYTSPQPSIPATSTPSGASKYQNISNVLGTMKSLGTVTTPYGGSTRYEQFHPGIDIANKIGTPVPAFTSGTIVDAQIGKKQGDPGYGNYLIVEDQYGNKHRYSHLNQKFVQIGQYIPKGTILGNIGNSGSTYSLSGGTGAHLDYRILNAANKYINPITFYSKRK